MEQSNSDILISFNSNLFLNILKQLYEDLYIVREFIDELKAEESFAKMNLLNGIFIDIFSDFAQMGIIEFKINRVPKSTVSLFIDPRLLAEDSFVNHITINLISQEILTLDEIYKGRLSKILKFFKHIYSKVNNYIAKIEGNQLPKFRKILDEIRLDYDNFITSSDKREIIGKRKKLDESLLAKLKNKAFFYITHIENIEGILQHGILCHNRAHQQGLVQYDISNPQVNNKRKRYEQILQASIHDFTPLYINHKNPMLYNKMYSKEKNLIALLRINPHILLEKEVFFTDGNAATRTTKFYNDFKSFNKLNWEVINADYWKCYTDGSRQRCSEILIKDRIPIEFVTDIYLKEESNLLQIMNYFPNHFGININIESKLFF